MNEHWLTGPDLTKAWTGVLCKLRQQPVAFICDGEKMFNQFVVQTVVQTEIFTISTVGGWKLGCSTQGVSYKKCICLVLLPARDDAQPLCPIGGLYLYKFVSNN